MDKKCKVLIFSKGNIPYVRFNWLSEGIHCFRIDSKRNYKFEESGLEFKTVLLDKFISMNDIKFEDIEIDSASIDVFYEFSDNVFINPTSKWTNMWWNYDCPKLLRHTVNKEGSKSLMGWKLPYFTNVLVDWDWTNVHVDDEITDFEIEKFGKGKENTNIYKQMIRVRDVKSIKPDAIDVLRSEVNAFNEKIQSFIDDNEMIILKKLCKELGIEIIEDNDPNVIKRLISVAEPQTFDCGFLYFSTTGEMQEKIKMLATVPGEKSYVTNRFNMPWDGQSTTFKRIEGRIVCSMVKEALGIDLSSWTVLD